MNQEMTDRGSAPWARVVILLGALAAGCGLSFYFTGSIVPTAPGDALVFQTTLLFVILGSAIIEHKFTRPAESLVNALMGMVSLVTVYGVAPAYPWYAVFGYCLLVFSLSLVCTVVSTEPGVSGWRARLAAWTYRPVVVFGKARVLYSIVFLFAVFTFYGVRSLQSAILVLFWGLFIALWPLGVPELLSSLRFRRAHPEPIGRVARLDSPTCSESTFIRCNRGTNLIRSFINRPTGCSILSSPST